MAVAVAVAVSGGMAVPLAGLTKRFFNQKDFLINVWGYVYEFLGTTSAHTGGLRSGVRPGVWPGVRTSGRTVVGGARVVSGTEKRII